MTETFVPGDDYVNKWWATLAPLPADSPMYRASYIDLEPKPRKSSRVNIVIPAAVVAVVVAIVGVAMWADGFRILPP